MRSLLLSSFLTIAIASLVSVPSAQAEEVANEAGVFDLYLSLGIDGGVTVEDTDDDLDNAFGLGANYTKSLNHLLSFGGSLAVLSWLAEGNGNDDRDRNLLFNLGLRPEAHFAVSPIVDLLVAVNLGLTYSVVGEDDFGLGEINPALGFFAGVSFGARIELTEGQGIQAELALQTHKVEHEVDTVIGNFDVDSELGIGMLNLGYYFQ